MMIGAHYYAWYKNDWSAKTIRHYIGQQPTLGWYNNVSDLAIVKQQFAQCKEAGIDFLLVSVKNENLLPYLDIADEFGLKLTAHCETLGLTGVPKVTVKEIGKLVFNAPRIRDWMYHPAWLRIKEKPAIAYYVTRQIDKQILPEVVSRLRAAYGDCYLIGDEVWWSTPDPERLKLFDCIFAYNMYINKGDKMDKGRVVSNGPIGQAYLDIIRPYETRFAEAAQDCRIDYAPTVLPGYNDRGVRLDVNHYAIPREDGKFFSQYLEYASSLAKDDLLLVTSYNEWYEDSQIEPTKSSDFKIEDPSVYTEKLAYEDYGNKYLDLLKQFKQRFSNNSKPHLPLSPPISEVILPPAEGIPPERAALLDECALLYYQTTLLPTISLNELAQSEIRDRFYKKTEEAHKQGITVKEIRHRAKQLTHYFSVNRDKLLKESKRA